MVVKEEKMERADILIFSHRSQDKTEASTHDVS